MTVGNYNSIAQSIIVLGIYHYGTSITYVGRFAADTILSSFNRELTLGSECCTQATLANDARTLFSL